MTLKMNDASFAFSGDCRSAYVGLRNVISRMSNSPSQFVDLSYVSDVMLRVRAANDQIDKMTALLSEIADTTACVPAPIFIKANNAFTQITYTQFIGQFTEIISTLRYTMQSIETVYAVPPEILGISNFTRVARDNLLEIADSRAVSEMVFQLYEYRKMENKLINELVRQLAYIASRTEE